MSRMPIAPNARLQIVGALYLPLGNKMLLNLVTGLVNTTTGTAAAAVLINGCKPMLLVMLHVVVAGGSRKRPMKEYKNANHM